MKLILMLSRRHSRRQLKKNPKGLNLKCKRKEKALNQLKTRRLVKVKCQLKVKRMLLETVMLHNPAHALKTSQSRRSQLSTSKSLSKNSKTISKVKSSKVAFVKSARKSVSAEHKSRTSQTTSTLLSKT